MQYMHALHATHAVDVMHAMHAMHYMHAMQACESSCRCERLCEVAPGCATWVFRWGDDQATRLAEAPTAVAPRPQLTWCQPWALEGGTPALQRRRRATERALSGSDFASEAKFHAFGSLPP